MKAFEVALAILYVTAEPRRDHFKPSEIRAYLQETRFFEAEAAHLSAQMQPHLQSLREKGIIKIDPNYDQNRNKPHLIVNVNALQAVAEDNKPVLATALTQPITSGVISSPELQDVATAILYVTAEPRRDHFKPSEIRAYLQETRFFEAEAAHLSAQMQPHLQSLREKGIIKIDPNYDQNRNKPHLIVNVNALQAVAEDNKPVLATALTQPITSGVISSPELLDVATAILDVTAEPRQGHFKPSEIRENLQKTRFFEAEAAHLSAQMQPHLQSLREKGIIKIDPNYDQKRNKPHLIVNVDALQAVAKDDKPVLATALTQPKSAGVISSPELQENNILPDSEKRALLDEIKEMLYRRHVQCQQQDCEKIMKKIDEFDIGKIFEMKSILSFLESNWLTEEHSSKLVKGYTDQLSGMNGQQVIVYGRINELGNMLRGGYKEPGGWVARVFFLSNASPKLVFPWRVLNNAAYDRIETNDQKKYFYPIELEELLNKHEEYLLSDLR